MDFKVEWTGGHEKKNQDLHSQTNKVRRYNKNSTTIASQQNVISPEFQSFPQFANSRKIATRGHGWNSG